MSKITKEDMFIEHIRRHGISDDWQPGPSWQRREGRTFSMGSTPAVPPGVEWTRKTPARPAEVASDVTVPFLQALVMALVLSATIRAAGASWEVSGFWFLLLFAATWAVLMLDHRRLLWMAERLKGEDLDGDGHKGKPPEPQKTTITAEIRIKDTKGERWIIKDMPEWLTYEQLGKIARALLNGRNFSRDSLSPAFMSQPQYREFADAMEEAEMLITLPNNHRQLTEIGLAWLENAAG